MFKQSRFYLKQFFRVSLLSRWALLVTLCELPGGIEELIILDVLI